MKIPRVRNKVYYFFIFFKKKRLSNQQPLFLIFKINYALVETRGARQATMTVSGESSNSIPSL